MGFHLSSIGRTLKPSNIGNVLKGNIGGNKEKQIGIIAANAIPAVGPFVSLALKNKYATDLAAKAQTEADLQAGRDQAAYDAQVAAQQVNATAFVTKTGPPGSTTFERVNRTQNPRGDPNAAPATSAAPAIAPLVGIGIAALLIKVLLFH